MEKAEHGGKGNQTELEGKGSGFYSRSAFFTRKTALKMYLGSCVQQKKNLSKMQRFSIANKK
jgi:hypothetical protein